MKKIHERTRKSVYSLQTRGFAAAEVAPSRDALHKACRTSQYRAGNSKDSTLHCNKDSKDLAQDALATGCLLSLQPNGADKAQRNNSGNSQRSRLGRISPDVPHSGVLGAH